MDYARKIELIRSYINGGLLSCEQQRSWGGEYVQGYETALNNVEVYIATILGELDNVDRETGELKDAA